MLKAKKGFTLIELMIVIAIIAIIAAIAIPGLLQSQRASNERSASASLKTLASAEADFRANDRDANKVNDFWTRNVYGLYSLVPYSGVAVATQDTIRLIELSVAGADAEPAAATAGNLMSITAMTTRSAKAGFWYQALASDSSPATMEPYLTDTGGTDSAGLAIGITQYNTSKFGFVSFPDSLSAGRFAYILNEGNTIMRRALTGSINTGGLATNTDFIRYPTDSILKSSWGKMD